MFDNQTIQFVHKTDVSLNCLGQESGAIAERFEYNSENYKERFKMRITKQQRTHIVTKVKEVMGDDVQIMLFGSRANDLAKGGDIDLYIKSSTPVEDPAQRIMVIEAKLILALGDQKIDILLDAPNLQKNTIHQVAEQTGILL